MCVSSVHSVEVVVHHGFKAKVELGKHIHVVFEVNIAELKQLGQSVCCLLVVDNYNFSEVDLLGSLRSL